MTVPRSIYYLAFGRLLMTLRKQGGQNQLNFCQVVGVSQATLSRLERGSGLLNVLEYKRMAEGLGFGMTVGDFDQLVDRLLGTALPMCCALLGVEENGWAAVSLKIDPLVLRGVFDSIASCYIIEMYSGC